MEKAADQKNCPKHDWIKLDRKGECSFCFGAMMDEAIKDSEFESCRKCGYRRKAYHPVTNDVDEEDFCDKCGAYQSFS